MSNLIDFEENLKQFSLESKLEVCRKIAHTIDKYIQPLNPLNIFANFQQRKILDELIRTSNLFEVEYFALASTVNVEWNRSLLALSDFDDYVKIINNFKAYSTAPNDKKIEDPEWYMYFLRKGLQQHKTPRMFINLSIYDFYYNYVDKKFDLKSVFLSEFKYPFSDYVLFVISIFILSSNSNESLNINKVVKSLLSIPKLPENKILDMIHILSCKRNTVIENYKSQKNENRKYRIYDYNPFTKYPILDYQGSLFIPIPQYLFGAITEGFYHRLSDSMLKHFRENFGKNVVEDYIGILFKQSKYNYIIIPEFKYGSKKNRKDSPDYILVKEKELIFIEIKGATPKIELRGNDTNIFINQLDKGFGVGVKQCMKKEQDLINGIMSHLLFPNNVENIYYIVVDLEDFFIPPGELIINIIERLCNEKNIQYINKRKPLMLSVSLLVCILEDFDGDIFDFMKLWSNDNEYKFPDFYLGNTNVYLQDLSYYKYFINILKNAKSY